jgi:nucleoside-diphosphate-sugar epimerase
MRVGITGALGVVGTHLTKRCVEAGIEYSGLDTRGLLSEQRGDICNLEDVLEVFKDCDGIIHLAGLSQPSGEALDPTRAHKVNVLGTLNVIESIVEHSTPIKPKWLLFISCYHVYGLQSRFPVPEWARCQPVNELGISKLLAEDLVQSKCSKFNIPFGVLRVSSVYGSNHSTAVNALPNYYIQQMLKEEVMICPRDNTTYDFIHVDDVVDAILKSIRRLHHHKKSLPVMNICSSVETRAGDLVTILHQLANTSEDIKILHSYQKQGERFVGSCEKARSVLGWTPKIQLYEGIERLYHTLKQTQS